MAADPALRLCHQGATNTQVKEMRVEQSLDEIKGALTTTGGNEDATNSTGGLDDSFKTMVSNGGHVRGKLMLQMCKSMQSFVDCLLKRGYWETCPDALQAEVDLLRALPPKCTVSFVPPRPG
jgi:hypothetical protein